jgi:hypothetical protein
MTRSRSKDGTRDFNVVRVVNEIGDEVEEVLASRKKEKYFEEVILLYSLIENLLKWSVFMKIFWEKVDEKVPSGEELDRLRGYCKRSIFRNALNVSLCVKLISFNLYKK